jgi:hypothetical protein
MAEAKVHLRNTLERGSLMSVFSINKNDINVTLHFP